MQSGETELPMSGAAFSLRPQPPKTLRHGRVASVTYVITLFALLSIQVRRDGPTWAPGELEGAIIRTLVGCAIAFAIYRLVPRAPWPRPWRWRFVAIHAVAAPVAAATWHLVSANLGSLVTGYETDAPFSEMVFIGSFLYVAVASFSYAAHAAARAAQADAVAARTQLATLRSQLQPHFLFNTLHTIVQLIQIDPRRATEAAELVADLLRRALEEQRDEVPLRDEWRFVSGYLAIEQMRFGERLVVKADLPPEVQSERVPSFALQTLIENAVQHGAAPRVSPTEIAITARRTDSTLVISVRNSGDGSDGSDVDAPRTDSRGTGTGLPRLRERLAVLYGGVATLVSGPMATGGYEAELTVPRNGLGAA